MNSRNDLLSVLLLLVSVIIGCYRYPEPLLFGLNWLGLTDSDDAVSNLSLSGRVKTYRRRGTPDTTAVVLNWSRFQNVVEIAALLCDHSLEDTIYEVVVWNNSPREVLRSDFRECSGDRLSIYNSPENLYFQARFMACSRALTPYCFIQDDDYLVLAEVIHAMRSRLSPDSEAIYVLPPHEMLSSELKTIHNNSSVHTSLAWLGHGAMFPRSLAVDFLAAMDTLEMSELEHKMADNYFSILRNVVPEVWFDQGIELGGGEAFTVGIEGDERNRRHFARATELLLSTIKQDRDIPFVNRQLDTRIRRVYRSPCRGTPCLFETTISTLPDALTSAQSKVSEDLSAQDDELRSTTGNTVLQHYVDHPPSHAVDGRRYTFFESLSGGKEGDTVTLDILQSLDSEFIEMVLFVDSDTASKILRESTVSLRSGLNSSWLAFEHELHCTSSAASLFFVWHGVQKCTIRVTTNTNSVQQASLSLRRDVDARWRIYESWIV